MKIHHSGSNQVLSSIDFMSNGTIKISDHHELKTCEEAAMLSMTQNFLLYSLERDDWLMHYLSEVNETLKEEADRIKRPSLTLIQGGLADA